jgi:AcrR family transcriptional regulator
MPRVSEQYRATRRAEIVAAAARLFSANGFHATSMADIISEAGLSAGAVYIYFRSKEDLIAAVAETALSAADEAFATLLADGAAPSPEHALTTMIHVITRRIAEDPGTGVDISRIGLQVWAEALRSPQLADRTDEVYQRLRGHFAEVARRWQAAGKLPAGAVPDEVGAAMLGLVQGFVLQRLLIRGTDPGTYLAGVRALLVSSVPA